MNFKEIIEKTKELDMSNSDIGYGEFDEAVFGKIKQVFGQGGEGKGEDWERVYFFEEHGVYLSMSGFYSSYNGTDFDGYEPKEVTPKEKTITVYE